MIELPEVFDESKQRHAGAAPNRSAHAHAHDSSERVLFPSDACSCRRVSSQHSIVARNTAARCDVSAATMMSIFRAAIGRIFRRMTLWLGLLFNRGGELSTERPAPR